MLTCDPCKIVGHRYDQADLEKISGGDDYPHPCLQRGLLTTTLARWREAVRLQLVAYTILHPSCFGFSDGEWWVKSEKVAGCSPILMRRWEKKLYGG